jgi:ribosomal-protein-alanine N-acetyltransferase
MTDSRAEMVLSLPHVIATERLLIRRFELSDLGPFVRFMTTAEVTRYLPFPAEMKTADGAQQLLEATIAAYDLDPPLHAFAIEDKATRAFVGCCGVNPLAEGEAEIFYAILPEHWRRGIAPEVARALADHLLHEAGLRVVRAFIVPGNEASERVARKVGFWNTGLVANPNFVEPVYQYVLEWGKGATSQ